MPYRAHLAKDKKLKKILANADAFELKKADIIHLAVCKSIISQQLSTKVAAVIFQRFLNLFKTKTPSPRQILAIDTETLRSIGLSYAKAGYVHNVCRFWMEHKLTDEKIHGLENEELINLLTQIKGIGRWSAEMILMFSLGREDVFSPDDLGIQQAMIKLYELKPDNKKHLRELMLTQSQKWAPYRTYACLHLWAWKDGD